MRAWIAELEEEAKSAWEAFRAYWNDQVRSLLMTLLLFLAMAAPIIIVILILWYLDSIGWRAGSGFYTIGTASILQSLVFRV
ncbi:hypothetical protein [Rubrivivax sp. A210]|uniref:hypothetical protein n=1 Tax=Rubrivivax sp. A210 TaxID=2772301 RepID=UPI00191A323A|nr:hypothetical protein [Rubrivivax sp. A210]